MHVRIMTLPLALALEEAVGEALDFSRADAP